MKFEKGQQVWYVDKNKLECSGIVMVRSAGYFTGDDGKQYPDNRYWVNGSEKEPEVDFFANVDELYDYITDQWHLENTEGYDS